VRKQSSASATFITCCSVGPISSRTRIRKRRAFVAIVGLGAEKKDQSEGAIEADDLHAGRTAPREVELPLFDRRVEDLGVVEGFRPMSLAVVFKGPEGLVLAAR
jgi:hypothetical protein